MSRDGIRNASYDYARLLAVIGIIWFHAQAPGAYIGYSGLSFFVLLMMGLALPQIAAQREQRHRAPAFLRYAAARGRRLLVPWLVASAFYGGLKLIEVVRGASFSAEFTKEMWVTGTALHLWFLPFAFAMTLALWPVGHWLRKAPVWVWPPLTLIFGGGALVALAGMQVTAQPVPLAQWAYALPAVLLGTALALGRENIVSMMGILALFVGIALMMSWTVGLFQIGVAGIVLIFCTLIYIPPTALSGRAARASLWIYLIHPAVLTVVQRGGLAAAHSMMLALITTLFCLVIVAIFETILQGRRTPGLLTS